MQTALMFFPGLLGFSGFSIFRELDLALWRNLHLSTLVDFPFWKSSQTALKLFGLIDAEEFLDLLELRLLLLELDLPWPPHDRGRVELALVGAGALYFSPCDLAIRSLFFLILSLVRRSLML